MSGVRGAAALRREIRDRARRERLTTTIQALGDTEAGREFGLLRLNSFEDFRASVPLLDPVTHAERVTARLGFGLDEFDGETLSAASVERAAVRAAWVEQLGSTRPRRIAVLHAAADDLLVERMRLDDLRTLGDAVEIMRINTMPTDPERLIEDLRRFRADMMLVPSLATCGWLEQLLRAPLERKLPQLRWLMAEHDLDERVRSRLPVINAGWLHGAGRVGLPARRSPHDAFTLAVRSSLIELLPHGDPENDRRQQLTERTVLPEAAILGERYELVLSSPLGFLRLRSGLHVRVVGFSNPGLIEAAASDEPGATGSHSLPCPRVVRLPTPPADAALEGVTLTGAWLTASVRQAFLPEDPALIAAEIAADPDALDVSGRASRTGLDPFTDTELGASRAGSRRRGPKPRALVVRLEVQGQAVPAFPMRVSERIDLDLRRRSGAYDWLRTADELWEPRVVIARSGTARKTRERRIRALWGSVARPVVQMA
ncbi:hypothetical protein DB30_04106 [Enhygromyxa salina]|uniref:GH3 auxin-responsive promoter n=1 Tax=Enhygromyxa salina TaxID=215803 RepID=A0A0C2DA42_9BACT|nr:GH3 auxin-responsive promoter family protein [Enhygromyxa salina]KIG16762.1 hypothetical protein DB30_04106 [Enhygromyxa salina]